MIRFYTLFRTSAIAVIWMLALSCSPEEGRMPNIILIVADDLGWKDTGFMGSEFYETPGLDRLAREGMVFSRAYATAANCAPSRASLMTGRYATYHGVYTGGSPERGDGRTRKIIPAANREFLLDHHITMAQELKEAGYVTCHIGKWHLGDDPLVKGFDINVGGGSWGHPGSYFAPYRQPDLEAPEGEYLTDRLTVEAMDFIRRNRHAPFFLYLPYYAVHTPIQPKRELEEKYAGKEATGCQSSSSYAAMVENLDRCIGRIMDGLRALDLDKRTLVVFTSDNGGIRKISCQDPVRAGKGSYYEGGIRVPLVFWWTGKIDRRTSTGVPVSTIDLYPTLLEIAGKQTRQDALSGVSLWPLVNQDVSAIERPLFFHFPIYLEAYSLTDDDGRDPLFRTRPGSVVIEGNWKLHYYYEDQAAELYDLSVDPGERSELSASQPETTARLLDTLMHWLDAEGTNTHFEINPEYDPQFELEQVRAVRAAQ